MDCGYGRPPPCPAVALRGHGFNASRQPPLSPHMRIPKKPIAEHGAKLRLV
jgi:hypothetical protein